MKEVARNIDQVKRNREQSSRVKELSGILDGWLGPGKLFKQNQVKYIYVIIFI